MLPMLKEYRFARHRRKELALAEENEAVRCSALEGARGDGACFCVCACLFVALTESAS
jgi:hypothetical protein